MDSRELLKRLNERTSRTFESESRVVSFREYLEEFTSDPRRYGRMAAAYVADCFDHWGTEEVRRVAGPVTRWRLFDAPFDGGRDPLVGQEDVQREFYQALRAFAREGRADKLIFLHGPNGSAKTTFCELVFRALECYSRTAEGALHRFSWVFPTREAQGKRLGFTDDRQAAVSREETYAYLGADEIAAKITCELKDPPIFAIPVRLRPELFPELWESKEDRRRYRWLFEGELCAKCKKIWEGLFRLHRGNIGEVLRHVQVERYFISQRYRRAAVRVTPQTHVDASEIQVTADRSFSALPAAFQDVSLFVPVGDLVDGNMGMVEFSDFLKRPFEMNKYLLTTCEKGIVQLPSSIAYLNAVLVATSNEAQLDELKKTAIFPSFNARMDLVTVPYLLQVSLEERVYDDLLQSEGQRKHVAPHLGRIAATWAVLCRLHRPDPDDFPAEARALVRDLKPLEKARLYDEGVAPVRLSNEDRALLLSQVRALRDEWRDALHYEGRYGPSAREMRAVLTDCRYDTESPCISPPSLFRQLRRLVKDKTLYEFLRVEADSGYHDAEGAIDVATGVYVEIVSDEMREAMSLVPPDEYRKVFTKYVQHVNALRLREGVHDTQSGKSEPPDEKFIGEVEAIIAKGALPTTFRENLIGRVGAWHVDHPGQKPDYVQLFPDLIEALRDDYYRRNKAIIESVRDNLLLWGTEDMDRLAPELRKRVNDTMQVMVDRHGYCPACAKEAVAFVSRAS